MSPFVKNGKPGKDKGTRASKTERMERDRRRNGSHRHGSDDDVSAGARPKRQKKLEKMEDKLKTIHYEVTTLQRRHYIACAYIYRYKEPQEDDWYPHVAELAKELKCDKRTVSGVWETLVDTCSVEAAASALERSGRPSKLPPDNPGLVAAAAAINIGVSPQQATYVCNAINEQRMEKPTTICKNTLVATLKRHTNVVCSSVLRRKSGKRDTESEWAKARKARCLMTMDMFQLGKDLDSGTTTWEAIRKEDLLPLYLDGIVFCDQSHMRAVPAGGTGQNGSMSKHQWRVAVDAETGALRADGVLPDKRYQIKVKFDSHSQGCYAVCMPTVNGVPTPKFLEPFDYTGKRMVSVKDWKKYVKEKMEIVRKARGGGWAPFVSDNPFLERYGTDIEKSDGPTGDTHILSQSEDPQLQYQVTQHEWYKHLRKSMKCVCVRDFVLHLIVQSQKVYQGTQREHTFMIWHDRLLILWDEVSQAWLSSLKCGIPGWPERTWADRFVRIRGKYNGQVSKYYQDALPGDSPELMPLDCNLFNDVKEGVSRNVAFSFFLADDDPDKYSLRTPKLTFQAITKTINSGCPSVERIREDIEKIVPILSRIIENNGGYVEDRLVKRHGVRGETEKEDKRNTVDPVVLQKFFNRFKEMEQGGGVMFKYTEAPPLVELEDVEVSEEDDEQEEQAVGLE